MIESFIAAITNAIQVLLDKVIVGGRRNIAGLALLKLEMLLIAICMVVPTILWGSISPSFFSTWYILLFAVLVTIGFAQNSLYYIALKKKKMCEIEPITILSTPMTIVLAMIIFPDERSLTIIVIATIATAALIISRFKKKHLDFDKYSWMLIVGDLLCALEAILVKDLLVTTNAVSLYGLRVAAIAVVLLIVYRKLKVKKIKKKALAQTVVSSVASSIEFVAKYFAIGMIGVVNSSLVMLLGPIIVLVFSKLFLKEKITFRRGLGDAIIVMCVGAIVVFGH